MIIRYFLQMIFADNLLAHAEAVKVRKILEAEPVNITTDPNNQDEA